MKKIAALFAMLLVTAFALLMWGLRTQPDIHALPSGKGLYIEDNSCTINMEEHGEEQYERMEREFKLCIEIHKTYR